MPSSGQDETKGLPSRRRVNVAFVSAAGTGGAMLRLQ